jgi:hypothetical protein
MNKQKITGIKKFLKFCNPWPKKRHEETLSIHGHKGNKSKPH